MIMIMTMAGIVAVMMISRNCDGGDRGECPVPAPFASVRTVAGRPSLGRPTGGVLTTFTGIASSGGGSSPKGGMTRPVPAAGSTF